jgi:hypothetical protein
VEGFSVGSSGSAWAVIGRERDLPALAQIGQVEVVARGPSLRPDRTFDLFLITPGSTTRDSPVPVADSGKPSIPR